MRKRKQGRTPWGPDSYGRQVSSSIQRAERENREVLESFVAWLSARLAYGTIVVRVHSARWFASEARQRTGVGGVRGLRALTPDVIEAVLTAYGEGHGMPSRRSMQAAVRLLLEFAAEKGWVEPALREAVPALRTYRLSRVPVGVSESELTRLLTDPWKTGVCVLRDRAILWLLATYGARRGQIASLSLPDIDWPGQTIRFAAHKGGKSVEHALTAEVAEALSAYLREERPKATSEAVFLRARAPHVRLGPGAISEMVTTRMVRNGLSPRGPHAFRHAFATRLLRNGQPAKTIADLLGHRSLEAVSIYAKVDYVRLREVAGEWPEEVR